MSGMIGIEFFKNAFSPGTERRRCRRAGGPRPARHLVANTRDAVTAAADRGEVTAVSLPRAARRGSVRPPFDRTIIMLLWSSVIVANAKNKNKKPVPHDNVILNR